VKCLCLLLIAFTSAAVGGDVSDSFYNAIRNGDRTAVKNLITAHGANLRDRLGSTPLMYAAAFGNADTVRTLLAANADPNAANDLGATALMWAVNDVEKVRLLLAHKANVNAKSKFGRTPLIIAASDDSGMPVVRMLVENGADVNAVDYGPPDAPGGIRPNVTPLLAASSSSNTEMVRYLIAKGAQIEVKDAFGRTPLMNASAKGSVEMMKLLLAKGADVNAVSDKEAFPKVKNGPIALGSFTALNFAVVFGTPERVKLLLDAGARVNQPDARGMTPLVLAIACDHSNPETVRLLLERGADPKIKSTAGEDAYDWAKKFRNPEILQALRIDAPVRTIPVLAAGKNVDSRAAVQKSVTLLQKSTTGFFARSGCLACHAQNSTSLALTAARTNGIAIDEKAASEQTKVLKSMWGIVEQALLQHSEPPGMPDLGGYSLLDMSGANHPADRNTDAIVFDLAASQRVTGEWILNEVARPPMQDGNISRTALAIRALQAYGMPARKAEFNRRVARAKSWLMNKEAVTTEDRNMKLLGLKWAGGGDAVVKRLAGEIVAKQRADGGWAQTKYLESDAYATGQSLYALQVAGVSPAEPVYKRGTAYLLNTQYEDGSWHVTSRSPKFQPYFESGFPHKDDQWISAAATAWAVVALAPALYTPSQIALR
jgi:ankyrin repeat protein